MSAGGPWQRARETSEVFAFHLGKHEKLLGELVCAGHVARDDIDNTGERGQCMRWHLGGISRDRSEARVGMAVFGGRCWEVGVSGECEARTALGVELRALLLLVPPLLFPRLVLRLGLLLELPRGLAIGLGLALRFERELLALRTRELRGWV